MKNNNTMLIVIVAVAILVGAYFYFSGTAVTADRGANGWWNVEAQQCWTTPTSLNGGTNPVTSCCFDQEGYQVDCQGSARLSDEPLV